MADAEKQPLLQNEASSDYATLAEANEGTLQIVFFFVYFLMIGGWLHFSCSFECSLKTLTMSHSRNISLIYRRQILHILGREVSQSDDRLGHWSVTDNSILYFNDCTLRDAELIALL